MAVRRHSRECAVQLLFQFDLNPPTDMGAAFQAFWVLNTKRQDPQIHRFAEILVRGVHEHAKEIDEIIKGAAHNWDMKRMGVIERNVLRMGTYEILFSEDVPPAVIINEAVDIAKYFSMTESGRFVNGILDRIRKDHEKNLKVASAESAPPAHPHRHKLSGASASVEHPKSK